MTVTDRSPIKGTESDFKDQEDEENEALIREAEQLRAAQAKPPPSSGMVLIPGCTRFVKTII